MAGGEHSFAAHENDLVYALGLDYVAQTGAIEQEREDTVNMLRPYHVKSLKGRAKAICIGGGNYRNFSSRMKGSVSHTADGTPTSLATNFANLPPEDLFPDARGKPRILTLLRACRLPPMRSSLSQDATSVWLLQETQRSTVGLIASSVESGRVLLTIEEAILVGSSSITGQKIVRVDFRGHYSVLAEEVGAMTTVSAPGRGLGSYNGGDLVLLQQS